MQKKTFFPLKYICLACICLFVISENFCSECVWCICYFIEMIISIFGYFCNVFFRKIFLYSCILVLYLYLFFPFLAYLWPLESNCDQKYASGWLAQVENQFYYLTMHFWHFEISFGFIIGNSVFLTLFRAYFCSFLALVSPKSLTVTENMLHSDTFR